MATGINLATHHVIPFEGSAMMVRNFQAVGLQSDEITGECSATLDFGVNGIWGIASQFGEDVSVTLTTGSLATGVVIAWDAAPELDWRIRIGEGATGTIAYNVLF